MTVPVGKRPLLSVIQPLRRPVRARSFASAGGAALFLAASAAAGAAVAAPPAAGPPASLAAVPALRRWDPARQGPLLIVDPGHTSPLPKAERPVADVVNGTVRAAAAVYGRKIVACGTVTVLAPTTMVKIGPPAEPPYFQGQMEFVAPLTFLLSTLTADQWRAVTSGAGLPVSALTPGQKTWLDHILPLGAKLFPRGGGKDRELTDADREGASLRLSRDVAVTLDSADPDGQGLGFDSTLVHGGTAGAPLYLEDRDAEDAAERAKRTREPVFRMRVVSAFKPGDIDLTADGPNAALLARPVSLAADADGLTVGDLIRRAAKATGWELYADKRAARLSVRVLQTPDAPPVRAGDLLRALCWAVTGAFRRVGPVPGPAAYLLTDDREGIGARVARIEEWVTTAREMSSDAESRADNAIAAAKVGGLLAFAPDDPFALSPDLTRRLLKPFATWDSTVHRKPDDDRFGVDELPPAYRQFAEKQAKIAADDTQHPQRLSKDHVHLRPTLAFDFLLADGSRVGTLGVDPDIYASLSEDLNAPEPDAPAPPPSPENAALANAALTATQRVPKKPALAAFKRPIVLATAARTAEDARAAVLLARRYGFAQLWLAVPAGADGRSLLAAALAESATARPAVPLVATLSLLKAPPGAPDAPAEQADRNILGDSSEALRKRRAGAPDAITGGTTLLPALQNLLSPPGDLLRFDTPALAAARVHPVLDTGAVPGLAGLALADTAAPGYGSFHETFPDWYSGLGSSGDFGYTPELRLAFLRAEGYDPIDLTVDGGNRIGEDVSLPFFPDRNFPPYQSPEHYAQEHIALADLPQARWNRFRLDANEKFLADVYGKLKAARPSLPLYLAERGGSVYGPKFWATWDTPDRLPADHEYDSPGQGVLSRDPHAVSRRAFLTISVRDPENLPQEAMNVTFELAFRTDRTSAAKYSTGLKEDGYVIDLRRLTVGQAQQLVGAAFAPAASR